MVKRTASYDENEPEQKQFLKPSEKEHLFQVVEVYDSFNPVGRMKLDNDTVCVKCEVVGGEEEGRTLLNRLSLDENFRGFFATRLFLKAIGEPYKGKDFVIDTENWIGREFYATVFHNKEYANINEYNFEKLADNAHIVKEENKRLPEEVAWDEVK